VLSSSSLSVQEKLSDKWIVSNNGDTLILLDRTGEKKLKIPSSIVSNSSSSSSSNSSNSSSSNSEEEDPKLYFSNLVEPLVEKASKEQIRALVGELFEKLWGRSGEKVTKATIRPFHEEMKKVESTSRNNGMEGLWLLRTDVEVGHNDEIKLTMEGFGVVRWEGVDLQLVSSITDEILEFRGDLCQWEDCVDDFEVRMNLKYDEVDDIISGRVKVTPVREVQFGPPSAFGGGYFFVGSRYDSACKRKRN